MRYSKYFLRVLSIILIPFGVYAQNGGNALSFDGVNDFVKVDAGSGSGLNFGGGSQFTVSMWVYPNNPGAAGDQTLFHKHHNFVGTAQYTLWLNAGVLNARIDRFSAGGNFFMNGVTPVLTQSKWYYVTLVKTASAFQIYVDGILYNSASIPVTQLGASSSIGNIYFGVDGSGAAPFNGKLDEIKVWSSTRTSTEIRRDMYKPETSGTANLPLYLTLDEGTGQLPSDGGNSPVNNVYLGMDGTVETTDPTWAVSGSTAGPRYALSLDGVDEYALSFQPFSNNSDFSVEFWAKAGNTGSRQVVFSHGSSPNLIQIGFLSPGDPDNPNGFFIAFDSDILASSLGATDVAWNHYSATYNSSTGERSLYRNGKLVAIDTAATSFSTGGNVTVGSTGVITDYFSGMVDELRIWQSVRTHQQTVANMSRSLVGNESGLTAYYRFDQIAHTSQNRALNTASDLLDLDLVNIEQDVDFVSSTAFHTWIGSVDNQTTSPGNWSTGLTPSNNDNVGFDVSTLLTPPANIMSSSVYRNATFTASGTTLAGSLGILGNLGLAIPLNVGGNMVSIGMTGSLVETGSNLFSNGELLSSRAINAPSNENIAGFGASLTSSANLGATLVRRAHTAYGYGAATGINRTYSFAPATNTGLNASLVLRYDDSELNGNPEANLKFFKSTDNGTSWTVLTGTHNTVDNTFTLTGENSLGLYTAFGYVAPAVTLTNPTVNQAFLSLTPTLEWTITGGIPAFSATVQIYSDPGLTTLVHSANVGGALSYVVPGAVLEYNRRYWWRIVVTDGANVTNNGPVITFTTLLDTPVLTSPATEFESLVMSPDLSWAIANNRSNVRYKLLVGTSPGLSDPANTNVTSGVNPGTLTLNPVGLAVATKYWWTVRAEVFDGSAANNGEFKVASPERTFYTPLDVLTTPINGVTGHTLEPSFAWTDVAFETEYELRISTAGGTQIDFNAGVIFTDLAIPANSTSVIYNENTLNEGPGSQYVFPLTPNTKYYWQLVAKDGGVSIKSPIWHFTTYPAVTVSQHNPGTGDTIYLNNAMFTYGINQATNGLKFKLQVKSALVTPVKTDWLTSNFTGTSTDLFQTVNLLGGLKYYWRVVLLNNSNQVMAYSPTSYFHTSGGATVPYPSWPVGNPHVYTNAPQLYWYTAGYSSDITFDVQVKLLPLGAPVYSATNITNIYHQLTSNLLPGTLYYWQVRSVYKRGTPDEQISAWSSDNTFTTWGAGTLVVPNPSYPVGSLTVYTTSPYLYWWLGQDGTGLTYDIRYGTDPTLSVYTSVTGVTNLFHQLSNLVPGATYYWQVRSNNGSGTSAFSAIQSFSVAGGVANGYTVINWPAGNPTVYTTLPTLSWYLEGSPMGITGYVVRWKVGSNSSNWNSDYTGTTTVTDVYNTSYSFTVPFAEGQVIYWAVAATNGTSLSAWASDYFTIYSGTTPGAPVISWPSGNALVYTVSPQLSWWVNGSTSGIIGYEVVYSYSDVFANGATTTTYSTNTWLNVSGLVEGATYWWKVRAHFGGLSYGPYSAVESFTVNPGSFAPVTPIVGGPHNVLIGTTSPVISWALPAALPTGAKFELEVADNPQFTNSTVIENLTANSKLIQGLTANKSYFWRVRTKTSDGNYSYYSALGKFKVMDGATDIKEVAEVPKEFNLSQNYPNPFNPSTSIRFAIPTDMNVKLDVYNTLGEKVAELVNGPMTAGSYSIAFDASLLPSGIYFYRIEAGSNVAVCKMILMK